MRVIVTGSREWSDEIMLRKALYEIKDEAIRRNAEKSLHSKEDLIIIHGDCSSGADYMAHAWCDTEKAIYELRRIQGILEDGELRVREDRVPAKWDLYGTSAGPLRNLMMVNAGADLCLAFFQLGAKNKGTVHCAQEAFHKGIPVRWYPPDFAPPLMVDPASTGE